MPPVFGLPPAIQKISRKARQRLGGGVGVGRLRIVDEQHVALARRPAACDGQGRGNSPALLDCRADRGRARDRRRSRRPRSARCARRAASRCRRAAPPPAPCRRSRAGCGCPRHRSRRAAALRTDTRTTVLPARSMRSAAARVQWSSTPITAVPPASAGRQPRLDGGVIFHAAVAVEMIFRDVEQNADGGVQRGREIDLIGRNLQHVDAAAARTARAPAPARRYCRPSARRGRRF